MVLTDSQGCRQIYKYNVSKQRIEESIVYSNILHNNECKIYCMAISHDHAFITVGGSEKCKNLVGDYTPTPFVSVHEILPGLPLLGTNDTIYKYVEAYNFETEKYSTNLAFYQKMVALRQNLKFGYKKLEIFKDCVYNLKFIPSPRKLMIASDQKSKLCLLELFKDYRIEALKLFAFHDMMIQGIQVRNKEIFSFSSDNTVSRIVLEDEEFFKEPKDTHN